ncbi:hypothetical protein Nepgr_019284 [Nepenthes gracilis]|uniref:Pentatricopeptide repeat-containing protein n=1 Tax=Nepenthes gracilis TaxID=150966 RepID=A0AAD3XU82_NEPGR|nr:hypothetical protein Nepgr_019284 [Nepenthes gracilis]
MRSFNLHHGKAIHARLIKNTLLSTLFLHNHLLQVYVRCGDLGSALNLFAEMPQRNVVSWSSVIAGFIQFGFPEESLSFFSQMYCAGVRPDKFALLSALNASSFSENILHAYQIYSVIIRLGFDSNTFLLNALMSAFTRHGRLIEALKVFDECSDKDSVSWNAVMAGYLRFSNANVPGFWLRMIREGVTPDGFTFSTVLSGLAALSDIKTGTQVHGQLVKYGHGCETGVGNSLVNMYLKTSNLVDGLKSFDDMPYKNVLSWTSMAAGCLNCGQPGKALELILEMKRMGTMPNKFTVATALNACANLTTLGEGKKVHGFRIKLGYDTDLCVDNALLDMYVKCGCLEGAVAVFCRMKDTSVVSWTTLIIGFAQNGQPREALRLFDKMVSDGREPNYITFVCILFACSQGGFVEDGWKYFFVMTSEYGISPGEDHYACMVDLLGRAGLIKEAEELISGMPFQPGQLVLQTLLGACRVHGDIETGKRAAERTLNLDKKDPSTYVLLSNIFAGVSHWGSVETCRQLMETRNVNKMPGSSWVES